MGFQIEANDKGKPEIISSSNNRLDVSARVNSRVSYVSRDFEDAYAWSASYDYDAGDTILLVANTSTTKNLYVHRIIVASDTATAVVIHSPAFPTLAGTEVTGVNLNRTSGRTASASAYQDETGNTQANVINRAIIAANDPYSLVSEGDIILGFNDCIAVDLVTAGTLATVTIVGWYE